MDINHEPSGAFLRDLPWLSYVLLSIIFFSPGLFLNQFFFHDDLLVYFGLSRQFLGEQLAQGHFPLWNPYLLGGMPFFANPNSMAAYPLLYPTLLFPTAYGIVVFSWVHWVIAALGMHFFLSGRGFSREACRAGALTFACSGFFGYEIVHPLLLSVFSWVPWWMAFLERVARDGNPKDSFRAGLVFSLLHLSCHYQMSLLALAGGLVYFGVCRSPGWLVPRPVPPPARVWFRSVGFMLWGLVPALLWLIPSGELIFQSARFHASFDYQKLDTSFSLNLHKFWEFLFPANPLGDTIRPFSDIVDNLGFLGLFAPFLFFLALRKPSRGLWFWVVVALLGLGLALGPLLPFHRWACEFLPGFRFNRAPARAILFYTFSGCVLAAAGYECLLGKVPGRRGIRLLLQGALFLSLLIPAWTFIPRGDASILAPPARARLLSQLKETVGWNRLLIMDPIPYPIHWGGRTYLAKFPVNAAMTAGLRSTNGYEALWLQKYDQANQLPFEAFQRLMAVQWMLSPAREMGVEVSKLQENHPFVWAAGKETVCTDRQGLDQSLARSGFNPYQETLLQSPVPLGIQSETPGTIPLVWKGQSENTDREAFEIEISQQALVVFSEINYPGWRASLDGAPAPIYEADGLLRAVAVPAGKHEIRFNFRPNWLWPCLIAALLWLLSLPLALWMVNLGVIARNARRIGGR